MNTKSWGPPAWKFLFSCIMGRYPDTYDNDVQEHVDIRKHFVQLFTGLEMIMPCIYCRQSFKEFLKELPIEDYLNSKRDLMFWMYSMKDKVNKKLIIQEKIEYSKDKEYFIGLYKSGQITIQDYNQRLSESLKNIMCTIESPPFEQVYNEYEQYKASCNIKAKRCL